jgi:hypothetical protein
VQSQEFDEPLPYPEIGAIVTCMIAQLALLDARGVRLGHAPTNCYTI